MYDSAASAESRVSTPMNTMPRFDHRRHACSRAAASSLQGPHQDAQKFRTTGCPEYLARSTPAPPPSRSSSKSGATGPETETEDGLPPVECEARQPKKTTASVTKASAG